MTMLVAAATMLARTVTAALPGQGHVLLPPGKSPILLCTGRGTLRCRPKSPYGIMLWRMAPTSGHTVTECQS